MKSLQFYALSLICILSLVFSGEPAHAAVPRPDLTITKVWTDYAGPRDTWFMHYTVKNVGAANAGTFRITISDTFGGTVRQSFVAGGLTPGAARTYQYTSPRCDFDYQIVVDSDNKIRESNEANNRRRFYHLC